MYLIIILGLIIMGFIIADVFNSKPKKERRLVAYNTISGEPIYLDQCRLVGYNKENGNPIFENPYHIVKYDKITGVPIYSSFEISKEEFKDNKPVYVKEQVSTKKIKTEEDRNRFANSILMIVGAILVVIASIIFLASSWETISGYIKTLVLVFIQVMFFLFGYLCKNKLKIEKVAKVFNYLGLCFIPIVLISLSTFELVGDYLSINGEGFYLYLAITFIVVDILYKVFGYFRKDNICKIMSYVAESLAVIFIETQFYINMQVATITLTIYNILVAFFINIKLLDSKAYKIPNNVFSYIVLIFIIRGMMGNDNSLFYYIPMIIYTLFYYVEYIKNKENSDRVYNFIFFIITYIINLTIVSRINVSPNFAYILGIIPLVLLTKELKSPKARSGLYVAESIIALLFILDALVVPNKSINYLMTYIVGFIYYLIMYVIEKKPVYKGAFYILFTAIFIDIFYIADITIYAKYIPLVSVLLIYSLESLFDNLKDNVSKIVIVGTLIIESILLVETYFVLVPLLLMLAYIKVEKLDEWFLVVPMLTSLTLFRMNDNVITIALSYLLISIYTVMSLLHKKFNIYSVVSILAIIMAAITFNYKNYICFAILIVWSIVHLIRNNKENNYLFKLVNILSIFGLYISLLDVFDVELVSLILVGCYMTIMAITIFVLKNVGGDFDKFAGCFVFAIISLVGFFIIKEVDDALIIMGFLFLVSLVSFVMKWHHYLYESLIIMVINIIYLTAEFWAQIPWYFYILVIGMVLIIFAMFDEKIKQKKALVNNTVPVNNQIPVNNEVVVPEVSMPVVKEEPVVEEVKEPEETMKLEEVKEVEVKEEEPKEEKTEKENNEVKRNVPRKRGRKKKVENKE